MKAEAAIRELCQGFEIDEGSAVHLQHRDLSGLAVYDERPALLNRCDAANSTRNIVIHDIIAYTLRPAILR